ncbi:hypothetical protein [Streptomyces sp. TLI_185]|uniref:hypothetical protein n=1 Tax=Streptomyces sp. TLI_185 TaxID=2485151 RepID=UPI0021A90811|nr:hypothetical protein [Streptomyces sp. TLI_185]
MQEGRRRGDASARVRPARAFLQLGGQGLVRSRRRARQVPHPALGIEGRVEGVRQRLVHAPTLRETGGVIGSRADQRVAKTHPRAERHQARGLGVGGGGVQGDAQALGGLPQQGHVTDRLDGGDEQQLLCLRRKALDTAQVARLDAAGQRPGREAFETCGHLHGGQATRQFAARGSAPRPAR